MALPAALNRIISLMVSHYGSRPAVRSMTIFKALKGKDHITANDQEAILPRVRINLSSSLRLALAGPVCLGFATEDIRPSTCQRS
jgi:hypothetical protein